MGKTLEGIVGAMSATVPSGLIVNLAFFGWFLSKVRSGVLRAFFTGQFMETPGSEENCTSEKFTLSGTKLTGCFVVLSTSNAWICSRLGCPELSRPVSVSDWPPVGLQL